MHRSEVDGCVLDQAIDAEPFAVRSHVHGDAGAEHAKRLLRRPRPSGDHGTAPRRIGPRQEQPRLEPDEALGDPAGHPEAAPQLAGAAVIDADGDGVIEPHASVKSFQLHEQARCVCAKDPGDERLPRVNRLGEDRSSARVDPFDRHDASLPARHNLVGHTVDLDLAPRTRRRIEGSLQGANLDGEISASSRLVRLHRWPRRKVMTRWG